jgi:type II secretory pathway predicted ATPase ExeA
MAGDPTTPRPAEAFALTPDPATYFPRLALESALAELAEGIGKTPSCAALTGEAGLGKTLLLHVLRERLAGSFECLYLPFSRLSGPELWRWVAVALGLGRGEDDRGAVLGRALALAAEGMGLALLVDDAGALPPATRTELIAACNTTGFSLVMAFDSADHPQLANLPAHVRRIELGPPMTLAELRAYVHARLRRADPDGSFAARLTPQRLAALHEASGGVPSRLHALLAAWLVDPNAEPVPASVPSAAAPAAEPLETETVAPPERRRARTPGPLAWLEGPRAQLALAALFVLLIAGFWMFALQRGPGVASVGVPVERFEAPREETLPDPGPAEAAPAAPEPAAPAEQPAAPADSAESAAANAVAG